MEQPTNKAPQPNKKGSSRPTRQRKFPLAAPIGALFVIFAVIGLVAVVVGSIRLTQTVLDNQREKEMFEDIIQPVLMFDPVPFESPTVLDNESLLFYSMWTILSKPKAADYPRSETQDLLIPAADLDNAAFELFGESVTLEHTSFGDDFNRYIYDKKDETYYIPPAGELYVYTARVEEVYHDKSTGRYNVIVGYVPPPDAWATIFAGGQEDEVDKTMIYVMEEVDGKWHLVMVVDDPNSPSLEGLAAGPEDGQVPAPQPPVDEPSQDSEETVDSSPNIMDGSSSGDAEEGESSTTGKDSSQEESDSSAEEESSTESSDEKSSEEDSSQDEA